MGHGLAPRWLFQRPSFNHSTRKIAPPDNTQFEGTRMRKGTVFARYFENLADGDPIAIGITIFFILFVAVVGLVAWSSKRQHRREEEEKRKRWGQKDPNSKK
jgi:hypothetical protein